MSLIQELVKTLELEASLSGEDSWIFDDGLPESSSLAEQFKANQNRPHGQHTPTTQTLGVDPTQSKTNSANSRVKQEIADLQAKTQSNTPVVKTLKDLNSGLKLRTQQGFDNSAVLEAQDLESFNHALYNHKWYQSQQDHEDHHLNLITGLGPTHPKLMVVNFQPYPEDIQIRQPFAGAAGELLRNMLKAIGLEKNLSYLTYLDHSSNPKRRLPREVKMLKDQLDKEIDLVQPKALLLMGPQLAEILLHESDLENLISKHSQYRNIPTFATYPLHYMTHDPRWKKPAWTTLQLLKNIYSA